MFVALRQIRVCLPCVKGGAENAKRRDCRILHISQRNNPPVTIVTAFGPGRKHSIAPRFGYQQHTVLFA